MPLSFDATPDAGLHISPAVLMETMNGSLYHSTQSARYVTLFAGCYAAETHALTYSNGGHLPPIIPAADDTL